MLANVKTMFVKYPVAAMTITGITAFVVRCGAISAYH